MTNTTSRLPKSLTATAPIVALIFIAHIVSLLLAAPLVGSPSDGRPSGSVSVRDLLDAVQASASAQGFAPDVCTRLRSLLDECFRSQDQELAKDAFDRVSKALPLLFKTERAALLAPSGDSANTGASYWCCYAVLQGSIRPNYSESEDAVKAEYENRATAIVALARHKIEAGAEPADRAEILKLYDTTSSDLKNALRDKQMQLHSDCLFPLFKQAPSKSETDSYLASLEDDLPKFTSKPGPHSPLMMLRSERLKNCVTGYCETVDESAVSAMCLYELGTLLRDPTPGWGYMNTYQIPDPAGYWPVEISLWPSEGANTSRKWKRQW
jgi:hypothetical protein